MEIFYTPRFRGMFKKLPVALQEEANEKIKQFLDRNNHRALGVHKLKGKLAGRWSFSVNYRDRIVFRFVGKKDIAQLLAIGDHSVYDQ